ncbi:response regulator [Pokkaliibacter sp. CJK22405]|uniref:response regulator n=1 Tax=Pokkaliibacter sp. CJK22405 TaxID=3384615 RepID=UPI0039854124
MLRDGVILLVEDNPDDELLAHRAFSKHQLEHKVITVRDGQEALDYLFRAGDFRQRSLLDEPVLILLDLNLPKVNGHEVLRRFREKVRTCPVVMLSTSNEQADITASYQLGANSFVRKPVDFADFAQSLGDVLSYWLDTNLTPSGG